MGEVMTDLQSRRSVIIGMDSAGAYQSIKTKTPLAELHGYSTTLRSLTQGRASFSSKFAEFSAVPHNVQEEVINANRQEVEA
jgi:elongation factor G